MNRSINVRIALAVTALLIGAAAPRIAIAQYKRDAATVTEAQARLLGPKVTNALRQGGNQKLVDQFFRDYYFPAMTDPSPAGLAKLGELRRNLFLRYLDTAQSAPDRAALNELTRNRMGTIAIGNYHPSVRYNATLVIGQLTTEPARGGVNPAPLPQATEALLFLLERDEFKGVPVPTSVRVAALVGLERHTQLGFDPKFADRITKAALGVATRKDPPEDVKARVYDNIRSLAVRVLANQYKAGLTQPVADALAGLLGNDAINVDERCRMASSLTSTMFSGAKGVKIDAFQPAIGKLAKAALAAESKRAVKYEDSVRGDAGTFGAGGGYGGGYGGGRGGGGYGGMGMGVPEEEGPRYEKRRALMRIMALAAATEAVSKGELADAKKTQLTELHAALMATADKITAKAIEIDVTEAVIALASQVEEMVDGWDGKAAPAAKDNAFGAAG